MRAFLLRRLLVLPLSLFLLSLLCFGLTRITPGDPVLSLVSADRLSNATSDPLAFERLYERTARRLGYGQPVFYFSVGNRALPDTLHRVLRRDHRDGLRNLVAAYGNWPAVQAYYRAVRDAGLRPPAGSSTETRAILRRLPLQDDPQRIEAEVATIRDDPGAAPVVAAYDRMRANPDRRTLLLPTLHFHGTGNQYHHWLGNALLGDLGVSYTDGRPVGAKIFGALRWTALLNGLALLLVYLVALPVGLYAAGYRGGWFDRISSAGLFLLFGVPSFWVATMVANFFTTPAFGMDFFPSMGLGEVPPDAGWWTVIRIRAAHLFLPVVCLAYPSWAYVSSHLRRSAGAVLSKDYVRTARLKGLSESRVLWGHVFRNASFPIITMLGNILPALLAGSILIERIFNLPGMGQLLFEAASSRNWPVIIGLVLLNGLLTALGLTLADIGYVLADPRVRLGNKSFTT